MTKEQQIAQLKLIVDRMQRLKLPTSGELGEIHEFTASLKYLCDGITGVRVAMETEEAQKRKRRPKSPPPPDGG